MLYIESIILYSLKQINGERTIYSIYHLLNGKKSSQTIQDAHLFSLKRYFRIYEPLTREAFDGIINNLNKTGMILKSDEGRYLLTEKGEQQLEKEIPLHFLNGWDYQGLATLFWDRLSLFVQVVSNIVFHESHYIPIQKDKSIHKWLKQIIKDIPIPRDEIGPFLYSEITFCLETAHDSNPLALINRLTGYRQIGLTALQTAEKLHMELTDYHLVFVNILHYLIRKIQTDNDKLQLLPLLLRDTTQNNTLTFSARKTFDLLQQGYSKDQISIIRNLKESTIEDHLVEMALNVKDFPIDDYVEYELQCEILKIAAQSATKQLKVIRNRIKTASYFQIRLVLAKHGVES